MSVEPEQARFVDWFYVVTKKSSAVALNDCDVRFARESFLCLFGEAFVQLERENARKQLPHRVNHVAEISPSFDEHVCLESLSVLFDQIFFDDVRRRRRPALLFPCPARFQVTTKLENV